MNLKSASLALALCACGYASAAATYYGFTYIDVNDIAYGHFWVNDAGFATSGDMTVAFGPYSDHYNLVANPNAPGVSYFAAGSRHLSYDDKLLPGIPQLNFNGILFESAANLFFNIYVNVSTFNENQYSIIVANDSTLLTGDNDNGTFRAVAQQAPVPEPATMSVIALGVGALLRKKAKKA